MIVIIQFRESHVNAKYHQMSQLWNHIDIDEIFYHQIEEKFKQQHLAEQKKLQDEVEAKRKEYKAHLDTLKAKEEALKEEKEKFDEDLRQSHQRTAQTGTWQSFMMNLNVSW